MKLVQPIPEHVVKTMADKLGPDSAAAKVLVEAAEIRAKGNQVRFWLTDEPSLCVQEGVTFISTEHQ